VYCHQKFCWTCGSTSITPKSVMINNTEKERYHVNAGPWGDGALQRPSSFDGAPWDCWFGERINIPVPFLIISTLIQCLLFPLFHMLSNACCTMFRIMYFEHWKKGNYFGFICCPLLGIPFCGFCGFLTMPCGLVYTIQRCLRVICCWSCGNTYGSDRRQKGLKKFAKNLEKTKFKNALMNWDEGLAIDQNLPNVCCPRGHLMGTFHVQGPWICSGNYYDSGCAGGSDSTGYNRSTCRFCEFDLCSACVQKQGPL
jgi:hypothetical protein